MSRSPGWPSVTDPLLTDEVFELLAELGRAVDFFLNGPLNLSRALGILLAAPNHWAGGTGFRRHESCLRGQEFVGAAPLDFL